MKTLTIIPVLIALIMLLICKSAFGADGQFEQAMKKNIDNVYKAATIEELQQAANAFDRIGNMETARWEPPYYASFAYIMMADRTTESAKKDQFLDQAQAALERAKKLAPAEAEVVALEGFVYMMRVTVDPAARGPQYVGLAMQFFGKAVSIDPENPRALALLAQMQYGTAQFFGSSTAEACGTLSKALEKFATFKSENPLAPAWGKAMAENLRAQCK